MGSINYKLFFSTNQQVVLTRFDKPLTWIKDFLPSFVNKQGDEFFVVCKIILENKDKESSISSYCTKLPIPYVIPIKYQPGKQVV